MNKLDIHMFNDLVHHLELGIEHQVQSGMALSLLDMVCALFILLSMLHNLYFLGILSWLSYFFIYKKIF